MLGCGSKILEASKLPKSSDVAAVVTRIVNRSFRQKRAARQTVLEGCAKPWMRENPAKGLGADQPFANMVVAVHAATQGNFGVIDMKHGYAIEANVSIDHVDCGGEAAFRFNVISCREEMGSVQARSDVPSVEALNHFRDFFESRPDGGAHSGGVLNQDAQVAGRKALGRLFDRLNDHGYGLGGGRFSPRARMHDEKVGAKSDGANELVMKRLDGPGAQHGLRGRPD